jgi:hypothetical protein
MEDRRQQPPRHPAQGRSFTDCLWHCFARCCFADNVEVEGAEDRTQRQQPPTLATRRIVSRNPGDAVRQMEDATEAGHTVESLVLDVGDARGAAAQDDDDARRILAQHSPDRFHAFVSVLGRRPDVVAVRSIKFVGVPFEASAALRAPDLERLLGSVLPAHPTLERIHFLYCTMPDEHWGLFVRSLGTTGSPTVTGRRSATPPLKHLTVEGCLLDLALVQPLAEMVRRNGQLAGLTLSNPLYRMDPDVSQLLYGGLQHNTHLRSLSIDVNDDVPPRAMECAAGPASPLESLFVEGRLSNESAACLAAALRTNTRLASLVLSTGRGESDAPRIAPLVDSVRRYNCTLLHVAEQVPIRPDPARTFDGQRRIDMYLRRNRWIQTALLSHLVNYRLPSPRLLWPILLERANEVPSLLYRILRSVGNLEALCEVARAASTQSNSKRCGRREEGERHPA